MLQGVQVSLPDCRGTTAACMQFTSALCSQWQHQQLPCQPQSNSGRWRCAGLHVQDLPAHDWCCVYNGPCATGLLLFIPYTTYTTQQSPPRAGLELEMCIKSAAQGIGLVSAATVHCILT